MNEVFLPDPTNTRILDPEWNPEISFGHNQIIPQCGRGSRRIRHTFYPAPGVPSSTLSTPRSASANHTTPQERDVLLRLVFLVALFYELLVLRLIISS